MNQIEVGKKWRHVKTGGEYEILGVGRLQVDGELDMAECVVYKSLTEIGDFPAGSVWIRPISDFLDGRFLLIG